MIFLFPGYLVYAPHSGDANHKSADKYGQTKNQRF